MSDLFGQLYSSAVALRQQLDFELSDAHLEKLVRFVVLLNKWNKAYNLSSVRDPKEMLVKHIFDSVVVSPYIEEQKQYADIGTGPGLPGIPLAIVNPDAQFTLVDPLGKRVRFIKQAIYELGIENVFPTQARVESLGKDGQFDGVLSRAFASLSDMLTACKSLPNSTGQFLAMKGQIHQDELEQIPSDFVLVKTIPLLIPSLTAERHLVIIRRQ